MEAFMSDFAAKHAIDFPGQLIVQHTLDISPRVASVAKDARNCIVAFILAWAVVSIVSHRRAQQ